MQLGCGNGDKRASRKSWPMFITCLRFSKLEQVSITDSRNQDSELDFIFNNSGQFDDYGRRRRLGEILTTFGGDDNVQVGFVFLTEEVYK